MKYLAIILIVTIAVSPSYAAASASQVKQIALNSYNVVAGFVSRAWCHAFMGEVKIPPPPPVGEVKIPPPPPVFLPDGGMQIVSSKREPMAIDLHEFD